MVLGTLLLATAFAGDPEPSSHEEWPAVADPDWRAHERGIRIGRAGLHALNGGYLAAFGGLGIGLAGMALGSRPLAAGGGALILGGMGAITAGPPLMAWGGYRATVALDSPDGRSWMGPTGAGCWVASFGLLASSGVRAQAIGDPDLAADDATANTLFLGGIAAGVCGIALSAAQLDEARHLATGDEPHPTKSERFWLHGWSLGWNGRDVTIRRRW